MNRRNDKQDRGPAMTRLFTTMALLAVVALSATADDSKKGDWGQLFNGKDRTGWKTHPDNPGEGRAEDGILIGSGKASNLFSERGDYKDFHFRIECQINDKGNSGQYFRTQYGPGFPRGYEAQINATHGDKVKSGSLYPDGREKDMREE